ncbi:phosphatidate phosphatase PAH2-like isoform X2 [Humulus lupulus]|uniref:phosphatidate phosphatase PAH2-like isoform X2 n=1 Tax=Humulus lupulus TaxID=3486 RepID=UPI002B400BFE|nr:phosphatidate phosphatase PAH2-like isoform X2 [Humulus lupulus]
MNAVGRLGSYISRGVYTVSGPFHPFGGAVDIIVVEQQDGSFKSSPWYVRFGKFQGMLKTKEKIVKIWVNGIETNFHMYLDHKGEAYFLREIDDVEEGESVLNPSSSSSDGTEGKSPDNQTPLKSETGSFDADTLKEVDQIEKSNENVIIRTNSRRSKFLGIFGRSSKKLNGNGEENDIQRADSLQRAEFAANLLEVKWSTNLATEIPRNNDAFSFLATDVLDDQTHHEERDNSKEGNVSSSIHDSQERSLEEETCSDNEQVILSSRSIFDSVEEATVNESAVVSNGEVALNFSKCADGVLSEISEADLLVAQELEGFPGTQFNEEEVVTRRDVVLPSYQFSQDGEADEIHSVIYCESSESSIFKGDATSEQTHETLHIASSKVGEFHVHAETEPLSEDTASNQLLEDFESQTERPNDQSEQTKPSHSCTHNHNVVFDEPFIPPLEEDSLFFGDIDEFKTCGDGDVESSFPVTTGAEDFPGSQGIEELNDSISKDNQSHLLEDRIIQENQPSVFENSIGNLGVLSSPIGITRTHKVIEEVGWLTESLPTIRSHIASFDEHDIHCLSHSLDSKSKLLNWTLQREDDSSLIKSDGDKDNQLESEVPDIKNALETGEVKNNPANTVVSLGSTQIFEPEGAIAVDTVEKTITGDSSKASVSSSGSWRLWPFSFRRSRSWKGVQPPLHEVRISDAEDASEIKSSIVEDKTMPEPKMGKKMVRTLRPTSEQLASLNLNDGRNTITFTFMTPMLGKQQVDARIYKWKWNTRIVISDVDGTITRSDVLGQFMPMVGVDWSHTGVAHLFSAIKENGYQLLFLSARAISQAYLTRQFLFNLKQDGKALPEGPVVISPDGLFPSLYREVIRRAPHEFKISCLEEIKSLFPADCSPFYAGFGNRDTDEVSYLKVGIPLGKIFIINPKGEVAVNRRVDTKSYKSIHTLVNGMFPSTSSSEQEDYNSWNFWRLPPPSMDI